MITSDAKRNAIPSAEPFVKVKEKKESKRILKEPLRSFAPWGTSTAPSDRLPILARASELYHHLTMPFGHSVCSKASLIDGGEPQRTFGKIEVHRDR